MSGCRGEERNIAIQSIENCDTDATLLRNGTFYFPDLFDDSLVNDSYDYEEPEEYREKRSIWGNEDYQHTEDYQYKDYDEEYLENDDFDKDYPILTDVEFAEPDFPKVLRLPVHVYLSPSWVQIVGKQNRDNARTVATIVLARANEIFHHPSMQPFKINLVYTAGLFFDAPEELHPTLGDLTRLTCKDQTHPCFVNIPEDERVAIVYLQANPNSGRNGIATPRSICGSTPSASIIRMSVRGSGPLPIAQTAIALAHEMAHTFGAFHDYDNHENRVAIKRTKTCGPPRFQGGADNMIMNFGIPRQPVWSDCSREDFTDYFSRIVQHTGRFCLEEDEEDGSESVGKL